MRTGLLQAAVLLAICTAIEQVAVIEQYSLKQRIPGALFQVLGVIIGAPIAWLLQQSWKALGLGHVTIPLYDWLQLLPLGSVVYFFALWAITDFLIYWRHRAEHKWFWFIHAVHHSPRELHAANDIGHPLQSITDFLFVWIPLSFVQMPGPELPVAVGLLSSLLTVYIHSPIDFHFGPLRGLIVDNRFHRIHHSLEPKHFDTNFGVGLSLWDWLFGTAYWPEKDEWPAVGVSDIPHPRTMGDFLKQPFQTLAAKNKDSLIISRGAGDRPIAGG
jgi:sterol desaturase/sphingolipid hydroxylase (fatty acid hydroxylase superfamily)